MKKQPPEWYAVWDPETGECVEVLDGNVSCNPCMLIQANYGGLKVERLVLGEFETVGDAVGRRQKERKS